MTAPESPRADQRRLINRRQQGDLGEASAIEWFTRLGGVVFIPFGHSPDIDFVVELDDRLLRVQVKTSTRVSPTPSGAPRFPVGVATSGGNQSWSRVAKRLDPDRFDFLFAVTGEGRRWCIPAAALEAGNALSLGGSKYSEFEIEPCPPVRPLVYGGDPPIDFATAAGEYPSGQRTAAVNRQASPSQVRILPPPSSPGAAFKRTKYERKLGRSGRAVINQKRRVTLPQGAVAAAGLRDGDRLSVRAVADGQVLLERIELPRPASPEAISASAQPTLTPPAEPEPGEAA